MEELEANELTGGALKNRGAGRKVSRSSPDWWRDKGRQPDARKHLFVVHSGFALLMMVLIVRHLDLVPSQVKVITLRRASAFGKVFRERGFSHRHFHQRAPGILKKSKNARRKEIVKFAALIEKLTGTQSIHAYTFDAVTSLNQILLTHPNTIRFSLVEEGWLHRAPSEYLKADQFKTAPDQELYVPDQKWRFFDSGVYNEAVAALFSFSSSAFSGSLVTNVKHFPTIATLAKPDYLGTVLALGPSGSNKQEELRMSEASRWLRAAGLKRISLKFHPETRRNEAKRWVKFLRGQGVQTIVVTDDCLLEAELVAGNIGELAAWGSSSLAIAEELGVDTHDFSANSSSHEAPF